jgi:hypothetical protein
MLRARREVYRVYDAEEFLADAGCSEPAGTPGVRVGERRVHQLLGTLALVAAVGGVGALLAALEHSAPAHAPGRRARSDGPVADRSGSAMRAQSLVASGDVPPRTTARGRAASVRGRRRVLRRPQKTGRAYVVVVAVARPGVRHFAAAGDADIATVSSEQPHPAEFGFER